MKRTLMKSPKFLTQLTTHNMVHKEIYEELTHKLCGKNILFNAQRDEETPFGYVLGYIRDMYGLPKTEGWDTAEEVCKYFGFNT